MDTVFIKGSNGTGANSANTQGPVERKKIHKHHIKIPQAFDNQKDATHFLSNMTF